MRSSLSLVTAVAPEHAHHLPQTAASALSAQTYLAGHGWEVDWVLVIDGPGRLPRFRTSEAVTVHRLHTRAGVAVARTQALMLARGEWVAVLDGDDLVAAAAVGDALADPAAAAAGWVALNHADLETRALRSRITGPVPLAPGQLADLWHRGLPFDPGSALVRREAALAVGGWPAVPAVEATAFLLAVAEDSPGVCLPQVGHHRRTWAGARSAQPGWAGDVAAGTWLVAALLNADRGRRHPTRGAVHPPPVPR